LSSSASIPLLLPDIPDYEALEPWLRRIDRNRHYTNFGPLNAELCEALAKHHTESVAAARSYHAQTFSNGTAALTAWLLHMLGRSDVQVLLPGITFVATAHAVLASGNRPLLADVDPQSWLLTPQQAYRAAAQHDVDAVMPVAAFGSACDAAAWDAFTRDTGIPVLIDAAGAFGNQLPGELTDIALSLHATKALAAGEGGAVISSDGERLQALARISNFGIDSTNGLTVSAGFNAKLSEYHAAVALASLAAWPEKSARRQNVMRRYLQALARRCPSAGLPLRAEDGIYTMLPILLPEPCDAGEAMVWLHSQAIQSRRWYCPPLHRHPAFAALAHATPLPVCERLGLRLLGLPFHPWLEQADIERVVSCLSSFVSSKTSAYVYDDCNAGKSDVMLLNAQ